ncbi:MAG: hypothetical protein COT85_00660 [Chlamydiae bacterium CG10_big_fil_rev_8_21_14_0_10_42_34]|nr:MAG: hypothetical protein COT85_00660 [Chlamydiae bacterium CG10_big_fil_rev_8_21_14_0_10_42_34]
MDNEELILFLKKTELFSDLSTEEVKRIIPYIKVIKFSLSDWIFKEGDQSRELYIIKEGSAKILKEEKESKQFQELGTLHIGDYFGEMAHLENEIRSAAVQPQEPTEVLALDLDRLKKEPTEEKTYLKVLALLAKKVSQHLRKADTSIIESLREKINMLDLHEQTSKMLLAVFIIMSIWFNVAKIIDIFYTRKDLADPIFTSAMLFLFVIPCAYIVKISKYPLSFYGLTTNHWARYALEGVICSTPILVLGLFAKLILIKNIPEFKDLSLIPVQTIIDNYRSILIFGAAYILLVPAQEFIVRGVLQSCFKNFFQGRNRVFLAILSSNLVFQMLHTVKGFWLAIISFFLGLFWGALFEKQKSLVGVCVSHALIGATLFFILDYQAILEIVNSMEEIKFIKRISAG